MLPYFETLLDHLRRGDPVAQQALGEHVHWGYWENPQAAPQTPAEFHLAAEALLERMLSRVTIPEGKSLLDVGCGLGGTINYLDNRHRGCTFIGLNIDEAQLAIARKKLIAGNRNRVHFTKADACALPFRDDCFTVVLCVESIFHFPDRQRFFRECARVLKPGGMLVISDFVPVNHLGKWFDRAERATHFVGRMYGRIDVNISAPRYRALARASGMATTSIDDITPNTLPTYRFLKSTLKRTAKSGIYNRATFVIELISRLKLLRYLILTFRKADEE
ncbi:MAG: class I SAM-dependent methyltransferase [Stellaceae bacterium]